MVPYGSDSMTPAGRSPNYRLGGGFPSGGPQQHGPPVNSMLERHSSANSPMFGRSPVPVNNNAGVGQQSPFFGGGVPAPTSYSAGRPNVALGVGWGTRSSNQSDSFVAGSSSSASNGDVANGLCYEDVEAMWRVRHRTLSSLTPVANKCPVVVHTVNTPYHGYNAPSQYI